MEEIGCLLILQILILRVLKLWHITEEINYGIFWMFKDGVEKI